MQELETVAISTGEVDIDIPSPKEVAEQLEYYFPQTQAIAIAEYVYQPLRELLKAQILRK